MGNFIAWLLGVPAGALVLAYLMICACILGAKRRRAGQDIRQARVSAVFGSRARAATAHPGAMAQHVRR